LPARKSSWFPVLISLKGEDKRERRREGGVAGDTGKKKREAQCHGLQYCNVKRKKKKQLCHNSGGRDVPLTLLREKKAGARGKKECLAARITPTKIAVMNQTNK